MGHLYISLRKLDYGHTESLRKRDNLLTEERGVVVLYKSLNTLWAPTSWDEGDGEEEDPCHEEGAGVGNPPPRPLLTPL
jgi:hypothetical protein